MDDAERAVLVEEDELGELLGCFTWRMQWMVELRSHGNNVTLGSRCREAF
jgi:hypothetical protein